jgi:hypothetical protein
MVLTNSHSGEKLPCPGSNVMESSTGIIDSLCHMVLTNFLLGTNLESTIAIFTTVNRSDTYNNTYDVSNIIDLTANIFVSFTMHISVL